MRKANYDVYEFMLNRRGLKTSDVCKATGIDPSTISNWKNGNYIPKNDKLDKLAEFFGIAPWDFWGEPENIPKYYKEYADEPFEVAAGQGRINDDYGDEEKEWSTVKICGDSMFPSLHDGDLVKVHHITGNISPRDFAIVKINGDESTCKHIEITNDGIWLRAENKEVYEDKFFSVQDVLTLPVTIIGVATEIVQRKL